MYVPSHLPQIIAMGVSLACQTLIFLKKTWKSKILVKSDFENTAR